MSEIVTTTHGKVFEIKLNRLHVKNALSLEMYADLVAQLEHFEQDDNLHVALIYGDEHCFSAGNDLKDFLQGGELNDEHPTVKFIKLIGQLKKPLVAAVAGPAIGIGTTMLLHCDLIYGADNAVYQLPFVKLGLCPEAASSMLFPRLTGHVKAFEWLVMAERFDSKQAAEVGLINEVLPANELLAYAKSKAQTLAAMPLESVLASKQLMKAAYQSSLNGVIDQELAELSALLASPASQSIIESFFKK